MSNLQEWLHDLGIKEFYRQSLAERMIDGFLLISMGDEDLVNHLGESLFYYCSFHELGWDSNNSNVQCIVRLFGRILLLFAE